MKDQAIRFEGRGAPVSLAQALVQCDTLDDLRVLSPLPKDAQELIDSTVVRVGLDRLTVAADIMASGLTYPLPNWLSVMELVWEEEAEIGGAIRTMTPGARQERQMPDRNVLRIPIYATMEYFSFNIRTLRASERAGSPLDTSMVAQATRRVNESIEDATLNGGVTIDGNPSPGLINAPNVNSYIYESNTPWDDPSKTGEDILIDVLAMIGLAEDARRFGPYGLYIPTTYGNKLNDDFKANSDKTIRQRLLEIDSLENIEVADQLPADRTLLVSKTDETVDMIEGQQPTVVSWADGPGWNFMFAVMACMVPRVRDDYDGKSGVVSGFPT